MGIFQATIDWPEDINSSSPALTTVHVLKKLKQAVICTKTQQKLGMINDGYPLARVNQVYTRYTATQMKKDLNQLMTERPRVFDGVCRILTGPLCFFHVKEWAIPTKIRRSRPVSTRYTPQSTIRGHYPMDPRSSSSPKEKRRDKAMPRVPTIKQVARRSKIW